MNKNYPARNQWERNIEKIDKEKFLNSS